MTDIAGVCARAETGAPCTHVMALRKATLDWLVHDGIQRHPLTSSGGLIVAALLLIQWICKLRRRG